MSSNTQPLPAAQLLKLADTMANTHTASPDFFEARDAYEAARAASPVTLEEALMVNEHNTERAMLDTCGIVDRIARKEEGSSEKFNAATIARKERREHARRLAGEGGGQ